MRWPNGAAPGHASMPSARKRATTILRRLTPPNYSESFGTFPSTAVDGALARLHSQVSLPLDC